MTGRSDVDQFRHACDVTATGQTIAHELCHVLTVEGHSAGTDDIMQEDGTGAKLTPAQKAEIRKFENKYLVGKCATQ